jgi:hypothetical protein
MTNYNAEKLETIESYIENPSQDVYFDVFDGRYDIVMVVDWGEEDNAIIEYCEKILETGQLSAKFEDADNKQGFAITIQFGDKSLLIPYQGKGADRDTTLLALNEILHPEYEIRFCKASDDSDTLEFIPLPQELWHQLDLKYAERMDDLFVRFEHDSVFFGS